MKKFYSIVLMAAALLVGTNAKAAIASVDGVESSATTLKAVFDQITVDQKITGDHTIKLLDNVYDANFGGPITIYMPNAGDVLTIDLGENKQISTDNATATFYFWKGNVKVIGSGTIKNEYGGKDWDAAKTDWETSGGGPKAKGTVPTGWQRKGKGTDADPYYIRPEGGQVFYMAGAELDNQVARDSEGKPVPYTFLEIGKNVVITGHAIGVYTDRNLNYNLTGYDNVISGKGTPDYVTTSTADASWKGYEYRGYHATDGTFDANNPKSSNYTKKGSAFGVRVDVYGKVEGIKYGMQLSGNIGIELNRDAAGDIIEAAPVYNIYGIVGGRVNNADWSAGVYGAGWSVWNIETLPGEDKAEVYGNTGIFVKAGEINIDDAKVYSNSILDYSEATDKSGIDHAAGSAIVMNGNDAYAGDISITVSGDAVVSGTTGYAVETYTADNTQPVQGITIEGGTFNGGDEGCFEVTPVVEDAKLGNSEINISGGNYDENIDAILEVATGNTIVGQTTNEKGETVYVITPNPTGEDINDNVNIEIDGTKETIKWNDKQGTLAADADVVYIDLENGSELTIPAGMTLRVGSMLITSNSKLIVEPGAMVILTSSNGISASKVENLVLQSDGVNAAILLINPDIKTNKQPMATVEMYTPNAWQINDEDLNWHRFASPLAEVQGFKSDPLEVAHELYGGATMLTTWTRYWNYQAGGIANVTDYTTLKPFIGYFISNNTTANDTKVGDSRKGVKYTFTGKLQGNVTSNIAFGGIGFNYFANSFTAPMGVASLLNQLAAAGTVEQAIWVWNGTGFIGVGPQDYDVYDIYQMNALDEFVCKLKDNATQAENINVNYAATVWAYNNGSVSPAPARRSANNSTKALLTITDMNGAKDALVILQDEDFSAEFVSGQDVRKYMNENHINFYVNGTINMSTVATDDLNGTMLSFQSLNSEQYTLSFSKVNGETLYIKDMVTGIVTEINEENTYEFVADANANNDYRFQIIGSHNAPTAVETIQANEEGVKAVYSIFGQYVGTSDMINTLPAGIYVVDGVKIVK